MQILFIMFIIGLTSSAAATAATTTITRKYIISSNTTFMLYLKKRVTFSRSTSYSPSVSQVFFLSIFIFLILIHNTHLCLCRSAHRIVSKIFTHIFVCVCIPLYSLDLPFHGTIPIDIRLTWIIRNEWAVIITLEKHHGLIEN